jgi:hypothetical protein
MKKFLITALVLMFAINTVFADFILSEEEMIVISKKIIFIDEGLCNIDSIPDEYNLELVDLSENKEKVIEFYNSVELKTDVWFRNKTHFVKEKFSNGVEVFYYHEAALRYVKDQDTISVDSVYNVLFSPSGKVIFMKGNDNLNYKSFYDSNFTEQEMLNCYMEIGFFSYKMFLDQLVKEDENDLGLIFSDELDFQIDTQCLRLLESDTWSIDDRCSLEKPKRKKTSRGMRIIVGPSFHAPFGIFWFYVDDKKRFGFGFYATFMM